MENKDEGTSLARVAVMQPNSDSGSSEQSLPKKVDSRDDLGPVYDCRACPGMAVACSVAYQVRAVVRKEERLRKQASGTSVTTMEDAT